MLGSRSSKMEESRGEVLPCVLYESRSNFCYVSKTTSLDVPIPVRILPMYSRGVYTGVGVRDRVSHPSAKGTLRASRAIRRPNLSRSGPHSKHPSGVAMDATLAEKGNRYK